MSETLGLAHFWTQADGLIRAVAILLLLLSIGSWQLILGRLWGQWRARAGLERAVAAFWAAPDPAQGLAALRRLDRTGLAVRLAVDGLAVAERPAASGELLGRVLRQGLFLAQARLERGLTFLASVGATAPFIGLFGTVWGIHRALLGLAGSSQVTLDRIAGPLGEALIMTAAGLFVAIPAVLAYNGFGRGNRLLLAHLEAFAAGLQAHWVAGVRLASAPGP